MIRVFLSARIQKSLGKLSEADSAVVCKVLSAVMSDFGNPHSHSGLGIRKLTPLFWECRVDLSRRILFRKDADGLIAFDIMTHDELRAFLRRER